MKTFKRWVIGLTTVALLVGCRTANSALTPSEIGDALLSVTDMGTDWQETQRDVFVQREAENPVLDVGAFCPAAEVDIDELVSLAGPSGADVEFQKKDGSTAVRLQAWSNSDAPKFSDLVVAAASACDAAEWTDEFGTSNLLEIVEGPEIGDSSVHWSTTSLPSSEKGDKFAAVGRTSVVQKGDMVLVVQWGSFAPTVGGIQIDDIMWSEKIGEAYELLDDAM